MRSSCKDNATLLLGINYFNVSDLALIERTTCTSASDFKLVSNLCSMAAMAGEILCLELNFVSRASKPVQTSLK